MSQGWPQASHRQVSGSSKMPVVVDYIQGGHCDVAQTEAVGIVVVAVLEQSDVAVVVGHNVLAVVEQMDVAVVGHKVAVVVVVADLTMMVVVVVVAHMVIVVAVVGHMVISVLCIVVVAAVYTADAVGHKSVAAAAEFEVDDIAIFDTATVFPQKAAVDAPAEHIAVAEADALIAIVVAVVA